MSVNIRRIRFSKNWNNKLDCLAFTTIRLSDDKTYIVGEVYEIWEDVDDGSVFKGTAELKQKRKEYKNDLDQMTCFLDTGMNAGKTKELLDRIYPAKSKGKNPLLDILLLVWVKKAN